MLSENKKKKQKHRYVVPGELKVKGKHRCKGVSFFNSSRRAELKNESKTEVERERDYDETKEN